VDLTDAIFGGTIEFTNFDGSIKTIKIKPGSQTNDKILLKNLVFTYK